MGLLWVVLALSTAGCEPDEVAGGADSGTAPDTTQAEDVPQARVDVPETPADVVTDPDVPPAPDAAPDAGSDAGSDIAGPLDVTSLDVTTLDVTPSPDVPPDDDVAPDATPDVPVEPTGPQTIRMGPALYHVGPDQVTVLFETETAGAGVVEVLDGDTVVRSLPTRGERPDVSWYIFPVVELKGYVHKAVLDGLTPQTRYTYRVASRDAAEGPYSFVTAPEPGDGALRWVIFGDNRTNHDDHRRVVEAILELAPDVVLNTGDVVDIGVSQNDWHRFFDIEHELLAATPSWTAIGNHESAFGTPHSVRYFGLDATAPFNGLVQRVNYGPLRLLVLNSQEPLTSGAQLEWLQAELAAADDDPTVRYLFVGMHQPLYTFSSHAPDWDAREVLWPLFVAHGVDAVFTGHNHVYERFVAEGVHHVVTGGGGAPQYGINSHIIEEELPLRVAARQALHVVLADIDGAEARFTVVNTDNGETIDEFVITPR